MHPHNRERAIHMIAQNPDGTMTKERVDALKELAEPSLIYIGGQGGCGKSWVEQGPKELARKWGMPNSVLLTGTTGAAAAVIGGQTIHSVIGYGQRSRRDSDSISAPVQHKEPHRKRREAFAYVRLLVIDEASMMGKNLLNAIERGGSELREAENPGQGANKLFGDLPVLIVGDY